MELACGFCFRLLGYLLATIIYLLVDLFPEWFSTHGSKLERIYGESKWGVGVGARALRSNEELIRGVGERSWGEEMARTYGRGIGERSWGEELGRRIEETMRRY
jgi:hypothetical protein